MQAFNGKIVREGQAVAEGLRGNFEVETQRDGTELWTGYFVLPTGVEVKNGDKFDLVLDDGRSKGIEVSRVNVYPTQTTASFATPG